LANQQDNPVSYHDQRNLIMQLLKSAIIVF